jgi:pimeloyl-ACP methyl ester carboxylesterase
VTTSQRPEIGRDVTVDGVRTNYLEAGAEHATAGTVVLLHGSGPGVTAYANWRLVIPALAERFHIVAPDLVGFGYSERPDGARYGLGTWVPQVLGLLDELGITRAHVVGNSFGGAIALRMAATAPARVGRLVLMGSMGVPFPITEGLERVWGYEPSPANMRRVLDTFAYSRELVNDELAQVRYEASVQPGFQEAFAAMFPAPRQRWVEALCTPEGVLRALPQRTLVVHGREDRVVPVAASYRLAELLPNADLTVFARCGHWSMIERNTDFNRVVGDFLAGD